MTNGAGLGALDLERLRQATTLAHQAIGLSDPNPRVGCILGTTEGHVLGSGHTQRAGGPHAEVMALRSAKAAGANPQGATAWVTLEPCAHHGRTPPCCDALIEAGIARVVVASEDPFPLVAGKGLARLRAAGIDVVVAGGEFASDTRELNIGFFARHERGRPWVRAKIAMSLDGRTALPDGRSRWITGAEARADGHAWRRRSGVVLTGIGTVLTDDPRMDVREVPTVLQPQRAVVDSRARIPPGARIAAPPGEVIAYVGCQADAAHLAATPAIEVVRSPLRDQRVDLTFVLADLHARSINEVHVEAGATLNGALLASGLVDELLIYLAPCLLGSGRGPADLPPLESLSSVLRLRFHDALPIGGDLRLRLRAGSTVSTWLTPDR